MSRRSAGDEMMENIAVGCIAGLFLAIWAGIAALIAGIVKSSQKTPEEQLRSLGAQTIFGAQIVGQPCPTCGESNEAGAALCFRCGGSLTQVSTPSKLSGPEVSETLDKLNTALGELSRRPSVISEGKTFKDVEIPIALVVGGILLFILFLAAIT